jgi:hypothetical protein
MRTKSGMQKLDFVGGHAVKGTLSVVLLLFFFVLTSKELFAGCTSSTYQCTSGVANWQKTKYGSGRFTQPSGNANTWCSKSISGWTKKTTSYKPKTGDIVVWNIGSYGHVGSMVDATHYQATGSPADFCGYTTPAKQPGCTGSTNADCTCAVVGGQTYVQRPVAKFGTPACYWTK